MTRKAVVLYVCYDGILEPLGHSQVWSYLRLLARDHDIHLISYEKSADLADLAAFKGARRRMREAGIGWTPLRYHKSPTIPATAWDTLVGIVVASRIVLARRVDILHARGYVPALVCLSLKRLFGRRFLFDIRGFWADQRADCGYWRRDQLPYRLAKWFEKRFLSAADVVVTLTEAAIDVLRERPELHANSPVFKMITTCADLELFHPPAGPPVGPFTVGCVGTVTISYLFEEMIDCFRVLRELEPDARLLILNRDEQRYIAERLEAAGIPREAVEVKAVSRAEVCAEMGRMHAGLFILKAYPSFAAVAPTKLGEFMGCGVPCLSNAGVGDFERIFREDNVGIALAGYSHAEKLNAARHLIALARDPLARRRCVESARKRFSLEDGVRAYDRLYREMVGEAGAAVEPEGVSSHG